MAKAASPIRLQQEIMQAAEITAPRYHRSTAEQIEYWAELGRTVSSVLNPDLLLSISSGLSRLRVEPVTVGTIDSTQVFKSLDEQRKSGELSSSVTTSHCRYQASSQQPGYLEQIAPTGETRIGQFSNGKFIPVDENGT